MNPEVKQLEQKDIASFNLFSQNRQAAAGGAQRRGLITKAGVVLGAMFAVMAGNNYSGNQGEAENELNLTSWSPEQEITFSDDVGG